MGKVSGGDFENRIESIFKSYNQIIAPFIMQLEIMDCEYPVEIFNEIRSVMTHLSRADLSEDDSFVEDNIVKAERHVKRAILDCYKYSCVSFTEKLQTFDQTYRGVDLSLVDNGEFLPQFSKLQKEAEKALQQAKQSELNTDISEDEIFSLYENAYNYFYGVNELIDSSFEKLHRVKHKKTKEDWITAISIGVGIAGLLVGVLGFFF